MSRAGEDEMSVIHAAQIRRVDVWEQWWRQRLRTVKTCPPPGEATTILLALSRDFQESIRGLEQSLAETSFDPACGRYYAPAGAQGGRTFARQWQIFNDLQFVRWRYRCFEAQVNLSLDAGCDPVQVIRDWMRASENFCKAAEPVFMASRLSGYNRGEDVWPMLAGYATARLPIGRRRLARLKALEELFWQTHPRDHPPTYQQLRPVLQGEALAAVPALLPFLSREASAHQNFFNALMLWQRTSNTESGSPLRLRVALLVRCAASSKGRSGSLLPLEGESFQAVLRLPVGVDRHVIGQDAARDDKGHPLLPLADIAEDGREPEALRAWDGGASDPLAAFQRSEDTRALLAELTAAERATLLMRADGNTYAEIAAVLGETQDAARKRILRVKERLREQTGT